MNAITKFLVAAVTGIFLGVAALFLMLVATGALAWFTERPAAIPGVFRAWFGTENDLPAMSFDPNGLGMAVVVVLIAALYTAVFVLSTRRAQRRSRPLASTPRPHPGR